MNTKVFSAIALFALANGALINMIMASRLIYGMAQQGIVPTPMGRVHGERRTPWVAIIFVAALALVLCALGDLESLADTTVLLLLCVFVSVNIAVLMLRRDRVEHDHWRAPTVLPVLGVARVPRADRAEGGRGHDHLRLRRRADRARRRALPAEPLDGGAEPRSSTPPSSWTDPRSVERRLELDRLDRAEGLGDRADLLGLAREVLERRVVGARARGRPSSA